MSDFILLQWSDKNKTADNDVSANDEFVIEDEIEDDELATVLDESLSSDNTALPEKTEELTELNCLPSQKSDFVQEKRTCMLNGHYNKENVERDSIPCAVDTSDDDTKMEQDLKLDESGDQIEISASGSKAAVANATEDPKASQADELMEMTELAKDAPATDDMDFDEFDVVDEMDDDDDEEEAELGDSEEQGEISAQDEFLAKKRPLLMPTENNFENLRPMGSTSPTLAFHELDKVGENEVRIVKSPKMAKIQEPVTRRSEPLPEVALFVDSLTKVSFDWEKYTCFYCNPCHLYLTSTALWEDHMMEPSHKKNMVRWKMAVALQNEICSTSKLQQKIGACREFLMGADKVIEVAPDGNTTSFVCVLCNFVCTNFDYLVLHLTGIGHIDTFMESVCSHWFRPPTLSSLPKNHKSNSRVVDEKWKSTILSEARKYVSRHGVGHLRTFSGEQYADWVDVDEDQQDMEEAILLNQVKDFLTDEHHSDVRADVLAHY